MPKVVLYDEDEVLKKLRKLFREKGFNGATMKDLCESTGLNPGSLYNSFGNKEALFIRAVLSYNEVVIEERAGALLIAHPGSPMTGLLRFFRSTFYEQEKAKIGCLITNSVAELDIFPTSIRKNILNGVKLLQQHFFRYLSEEVQVNKIKLRLDLEASAQFLFVQYQGFLILVKLKKDDAYLESHIENILIPILLKGSIR